MVQTNETEVEDVARSQPANRDRHTVAGSAVVAGLRSIRLIFIDDGGNRGGR
jgi:hypothetical protein